MADEISTIKEALDGAPVHAKEAVLKILERLTARVDRAERERDLAASRYRELHVKYEQLEEELAKKRGELRELLRQDGRRLRDLELKKVESPDVGDEKEEKETTDSDKTSERSAASSSYKPDYYSSGLPKIDLKSPARIIEEISFPRQRSTSGRAEARMESSYPDSQITKVRSQRSYLIDKNKSCSIYKVFSIQPSFTVLNFFGGK